jgi:threonine/homoserine/homoserine lactone efflux protein
MTFAQLAAFNVALLAAIVSPGPALLVAIRTTLGAGRAAGIAAGSGLAVMASAWTLMALLGLDAIFRLFPWAYAAAKLVGAAYLLFIAYRIWRHAGERIETPERSGRLAWLQGFLVNLANPKSVLFAAAVLVVVFPSRMSAVDNAVVVLNHLVVELVFYTLLAFTMSADRIRRSYLRAKVHLDRAASVVLGALGLRLLVSR